MSPANESDQPKIRILMVCTGNICRSPTAEGVFRKMAEDAGLGGIVETDSAGTHGYHVGDPPDARSQKAAKKRGYDLSDQRARRVRDNDFDDFDLILAMDGGHHAALSASAPGHAQDRIRLFLEFSEAHSGNVPDPYYGSGDGFELVLDMVEDASRGLIGHIEKHFKA